MSSPVVIREIAARDTYPLRLVVLRPNKTIQDCVFPGDDCSTTVHFGAFEDERLLGVASLLDNGHPDLTQVRCWQIRGMATDPGVRGKGFGNQLVEACFDHADQHGAEVVWCNARVVALGFYRQLGFRTVGDEFEIPEIGGHFLMMIERA